MAIGLKKAVVIGETKLCIQCLEWLVKNRWKVVCVVSDDQVVVEWAKDKNISILSSAQLDTIKETNFYLFSIINPHIIPKSFLIEKKVLLAINYHDSLLPKYAGINSTTWAIINDEKQHGITLHKIEPGVDEGDIVAQATIPIDKNETALSLNLKCSESVLTLFKEVVSKIEVGTLTAHKQDIKKKTYYGLKSIPNNYGIINGTKDVSTLYRLVRSLTFGEGYDNPVASTKIYLNNNFYIVEDFNVKLTKAKQVVNDDVVFNKVKDIYGNKTDFKIRYKDILKKHDLNNKELQFLSAIKTKERDCKDKIKSFLSSYPEASTKILNYVANKPVARNYTKKLSIPKHVSNNTLLALIGFVLARFFHEDFIVSLYLDNKKIPSGLQRLIERRNFICVQKEMLNSGFTALEDYLGPSSKETLSHDQGF